MKVGIDARLLSGLVTGIGRYTAELTSELIKQQGDFFLYTPGPAIIKQWQQKNIVLRSANCQSRVSKMLWSQSYLPYWAYRDGVDIFWGATHRLPRYLPKSIARVVTIHDLVWKHASETMRPLSRFLEKTLMPQAIFLADRIIVDSFSTAKALEEEYPKACGCVRVVHLGTSHLPPPGNVQSLAELGVDGPYWLFVGTLEPRKNLGRLLKAFSGVNEDFRRSSKLVIAGGQGWGSVDVNALISKFGLSSNVVVAGYVTDTQLSTLYAHALFLAMPSLYEGFGLPLIEAMSFGVPVLTSATSSMPEVAGDAGVLVDPLDEHSISMGLISLLTDHRLREQKASKAIINAQRFNWQRAAQETWAVFQEASEARRTIRM